jgi:DNA-binding IclR family transcriptional regulator
MGAIEDPSFGVPPRYPVESVDNALRLLGLFLTEDHIRVTQAADMLGVVPGTAHRLLATLQHRGFVTQDASSRVYLPGPTLLALGLHSTRESALQKIARPHLDRLAAATGETVQLATLHGRDVLFHDGVEGAATVRVGTNARTLCAAHHTAVGKALLAELSPDRLLDLYPNDRLPGDASTARSIATRAVLFEQLEIVRDAGHATETGELDEDVVAVATAMRDGRGRAAAAVGVAAPATRGLDVEGVAGLARECADAIATELEE